MNQGMASDTLLHIPVLPKEVLSYLDISHNGIYLDGTIGLGGHANLIARNLSTKGHLIGIDRDSEALKYTTKRLSSCKSPVSIFHESYHNFESILDRLGIYQLNGILLDLGLSSYQMDSNSRGFSYKSNSELDMRFDKSQKLKASDLLNHSSVNDLANIIYQYGEERYSRTIAKKIVKMRPLLSVSDLNEAVRLTTHPSKRNKTLARVFQALRIKVNEELDKLEIFLSMFINRLSIGGRIIIISFHSLEDRLVKHAFRTLAKNQQLSILTKKPITPSKSEIIHNNRSKSAKLRAGEKI